MKDLLAFNFVILVTEKYFYIQLYHADWENLGISFVTVILTQDLQWELQELLFEISPNKSDGKIFWKNQENPNFRPSYRNVNLPLKLNCISICRLKVYRHIPKKFEKSSVEILRKVVKRQTYWQTIHALDDPSVINDTVS